MRQERLRFGVRKMKTEMKFKMRLLILLNLVCMLSACQTINFTNGQAQNPSIGLANTNFNEWHHDGIFDLVEYSKPVSLNEKCGDKTWDHVTVQKGIFQIIARIATNALTFGFAGILWDPWDAHVECRASSKN